MMRTVVVLLLIMPMAASSAMMPVFRTQNSGYFLNIASISGSTTAPGPAIYSATKAALILLTEAVDADKAQAWRALSLSTHYED